MKVHAPLWEIINVAPFEDASVLVVDIGASPFEGRPPYHPLLDAGRARVIGFEPNEIARAELLEKKGSHETYLPHAIGDGRRQTLRICQAPGMTSLLEPNEEVLRLFHGFSDWGRVLRTEEVETKRLDDVPETAGVDYIKIDIQGAELMVFEHAPKRLAETLVAHVEVEFLPLYKDQPLFSDVDAYLRGFGFVLHRFEPLISRAMKPILVDGSPYTKYNQVVWADAIFVKSFLKLEALSDQALTKTILIMHDCYRAYDLAHLLLVELDRRLGARFAERYLAAILV